MKYFPERTARRQLLDYLFDTHRVNYDSPEIAVKKGAISIEQWIDLLDAHRAACRSEAQLAHWGRFEPSAFARTVIEHSAHPAGAIIKLTPNHTIPTHTSPPSAKPRARPANPNSRPPPPQRPGLERRP